MAPPHVLLLFRGHPPLLRRLQILYWCSALVALLTIILMAAWSAWGGAGWRAVVLVGGAFALLCSGGFVLYLVRVNALFARIRAVGCCACGGCGYDLRGHAGPAPCPECGVMCDPVQLTSFWRRYIRYNQPFGVERTDAPPPWLKAQAQHLLIGIGLMFAIVLASALMLRALVGPLILGASGLFLMLSMKGGSARLARRACARISEHGGLVCPACGERLRADSPDGLRLSCLGCARSYEEPEVHAVWSDWLPACWDIEKM